MQPVNKSHVYSFPTFILKYARDNIQDILANIFNRLLESGKYPSKFKMVKVIPIFKADDDSVPNNYRPISLLSRFKGIFKKLTYTRMNSFIDKEGILCSSQYGFRQKHLTEHAILDITALIKYSLMWTKVIFPVVFSLISKKHWAQ